MNEISWLGFAQIILPPAILVAVTFFVVRVAINQMNQTINTSNSHFEFNACNSVGCALRTSLCKLNNSWFHRLLLPK